MSYKIVCETKMQDALIIYTTYYGTPYESGICSRNLTMIYNIVTIITYKTRDVLV